MSHHAQDSLHIFLCVFCPKHLILTLFILSIPVALSTFHHLFWEVSPKLTGGEGNLSPGPTQIGSIPRADNFYAPVKSHAEVSLLISKQALCLHSWSPDLAQNHQCSSWCVARMGGYTAM